MGVAGATAVPAGTRVLVDGATGSVELDPDVQAFVERLERAAAEEEEPPDPDSLPSGDLLAREFQRFLRQRGDSPPGPGGP